MPKQTTGGSESLVDLRPPPPILGFPRTQTPGASESQENLHVSLTYDYKCGVILCVTLHVPSVTLLADVGLTLGEIRDPYVETHPAAKPEPILWQGRSNPCFPSTYGLYQPKQIENSFGKPSDGKSYRGRPVGPPV